VMDWILSLSYSCFALVLPPPRSATASFCHRLCLTSLYAPVMATGLTPDYVSMEALRHVTQRLM
jgi:hypothetical protein